MVVGSLRMETGVLSSAALTLPFVTPTVVAAMGFLAGQRRRVVGFNWH